MPPHFYKRPMLLAPISMNQKKSKQDFHLKRNKEKKKKAALGVLPRVLVGQHPQEACAACQHGVARAANICACLDLFCAAVNKVYSKLLEKSGRFFWGTEVWERSKVFPYKLTVSAPLPHATAA